MFQLGCQSLIQFDFEVKPPGEGGHTPSPLFDQNIVGVKINCINKNRQSPFVYACCRKTSLKPKNVLMMYKRKINHRFTWFYDRGMIATPKGGSEQSAISTDTTALSQLAGTASCQTIGLWLRERFIHDQTTMCGGPSIHLYQ